MLLALCVGAIAQGGGNDLCVGCSFHFQRAELMFGLIGYFPFNKQKVATAGLGQNGERKEHCTRGQGTWVLIPSLPLTPCMTLNQSLALLLREVDQIRISELCSMVP